MKQGKSRRWAAVTLATAVGLSVAACGGSDGSSDDGGTITLWHMEQPPNRVQAFQQLIDEYNATDPDYRVEAQVQDWDQIYTRMPAAVQSNTQPDLLFTIPDFTTYVRPLGGVRPVTGLVEELDAEHGFSDAAKDPYFDQDEYWAVPIYGMVQMLWYRRDLLDAAGVEPPQTTSELLAAAEQLTTGDGQYGIALPAGRNLASDQVIYSLMLTSGAGDFFTGSGEINFNTPETIEAFTLYGDLLEFSPPDSGDYAWGEPQAAFNSGAAAMAIEKGQYLAPFEEESGRPAADLGCAPIPVADGGAPGSIYYSNAAMVMSADDERAAAAEDFLRFILQPEIYGQFLNAEPGLFLPLTEVGAQADSWTSHEVIETYRDCVDGMLAQSETGALFGFVDGQYIDSIGQISGQNILAQVVQRIYSNGEDPADAVAWGHDQMQAAIAE